MFQKKIVQKYLSLIEGDTLNRKYEAFTSIFDSAEKQGNIRESKEEQYQEGKVKTAKAKE